MAFMTVVENRTWYSLSRTDVTSVTADEEIIEIGTIIENADASLINIAAVFSGAGKLYYIDKNGNENYLTDPSSDYPAKYLILATFFLKKGETVSLRYSTSCNMHQLYVTHGAGVF